jgi:hypothetical protein
MKRTTQIALFSAVLLAACSITLSNAQIAPASGGSGGLGSFADRAQFQGGLSLEFIPVSYANTNAAFFRNPPLLYGFHVGLHYLLAQSNDMVSLAVEPGINFSFNYNNFEGTTLLAQVPVYLIGRIGSRASKYNENLFGFGLGVGGNYTYILLPYSSDGFNVSKLNQGFLAPAVMAEISINPRRQQGGAFTVRFHFNVVPFETDFTEVLPGSSTKRKLQYENFGIGVLYQFN